MPKMSLDGGAPIDVADEKVAVYQAQGYALEDDAPAEEPGTATNVVKRPAKKAAKKAAKKS